MKRFAILVTLLLTFTILLTTALPSSAASVDCDRLGSSPYHKMGGTCPHTSPSYNLSVGDTIVIRVHGISWATVDVHATKIGLFGINSITSIANNEVIGINGRFFKFVVPSTGTYNFAVSHSAWDPGSNYTIFCR